MPDTVAYAREGGCPGLPALRPSRLICRTCRFLAFCIAPARGSRFDGTPWVTIHAETCRSVTVVAVSRQFVTERSHGGTVGRVVREGVSRAPVRWCGGGAGVNKLCVSM
ncbi:hypothetical protein GCM10027028_40120 [Streptomyces sundarbansensis]